LEVVGLWNDEKGCIFSIHEIVIVGLFVAFFYGLGEDRFGRWIFCLVGGYWGGWQLPREEM